MASATTSPSHAPTVTTSSAWSRMVQMTRVASKNNSRSQSVECSKSPAKGSPSTESQEPTPTRPAKRRRLANSPPAESATDIPRESPSQPSAAAVSPTQQVDSRTFYPSAGYADSTTACPCRVEDIECVAPPRHKRKSGADAPRANLRASWASPSNPGALKRQAQSVESSLDLKKESHAPDEPRRIIRQRQGSPTPSSDSISEAGIGDGDDGRHLKLRRDTTLFSTQSQHEEERSLHEIGAVFAPRKTQLSSKSDMTPRQNISRQSSVFKLFKEQHNHSDGVSHSQEDKQEQKPHLQTEPSGNDRPSITPTGLQEIHPNSPRTEDAAIEADLISEPLPTFAAAALGETPQLEDGGLQDGDQNSANKTPKSVRRHVNPIARGDDNQLITPLTSPSSGSETHFDESKDDEPMNQGTGPATKVKRRLNLHSSSYAGQPSKKKRKTPPKKQVSVQTTLSLTIGGGSGMRECKVCDTVYNPFHPEDAKVHAKRHAVVLKNGAGVC